MNQKIKALKVNIVRLAQLFVCLAGVLLLCALLTPQLANAATENYPTFNISWTAPDKRDDGSLLENSEIKQYNLFSTDPNGSQERIDVVQSNENNQYEADYQPSTLIEGEWCFTIKTVDTDDRISEFSHPVCKVVDKIINSNLNPPENVTVMNNTDGKVTGNTFLIGWTPPVELTNEDPLDKSMVEGYDVGYTLSGGDYELIGFVDHDLQADVQKTIFAVVEPGLYCFYIEMVTAESGRSSRSSPVCSAYTIGSPEYPQIISVTFAMKPFEAEQNASTD